MNHRHNLWDWSPLFQLSSLPFFFIPSAFTLCWSETEAIALVVRPILSHTPYVESNSPPNFIFHHPSFDLALHVSNNLRCACFSFFPRQTCKGESSLILLLVNANPVVLQRRIRGQWMRMIMENVTEQDEQVFCEFELNSGCWFLHM